MFNPPWLLLGTVNRSHTLPVIDFPLNVIQHVKQNLAEFGMYPAADRGTAFANRHHDPLANIDFLCTNGCKSLAK